MLQGIFKFILSFFFASIFVVFIGQTEALSNTHTHSIVRHDVNIGCADNAVAPLNSIKDIQTFLNCNGQIFSRTFEKVEKNQTSWSQ